MTDDAGNSSGSAAPDPGSGRSKRKTPPPVRAGKVVDLGEVQAEMTGTEKRGRRQPEILLRGALDLMLVLQEAGYELSRDRSGRAVVTLMSDPNRPRWYVDSEVFAGELRLLYAGRRQELHQHGKIGKMLAKRSVEDVRAHLTAQARHAVQRDYRLRACDHNGERWIDLCLGPDDWRMLRISRDGWSVQQRYTADRPRNSEVPLIRNDDMLPMAIPDRRKKDEAMRLFRARTAGVSEDGRKLIQCVMQAVWRAGVPGPLLVLVGPPGSWKTAILRLLQMICDPTTGGVRAMPTDVGDLIAVLASARFIGFDNKTGMTQEISDLLCQNATGVTAGGREFYKQRDHVNIALQSVVALTALNSPIEAADLGSRAIVVNVIRTGTDYIPEEDLAKEDAIICAGMMAQLADAACEELRNKGRHFTGLGRMADFERGSRASALAIGSTDAEMAALFRRHQQAVQDEIIEADPLIGALTGYLREQAGGMDGMPMVSLVRRKMTARQWWLTLMERWPQLRSRDTNFPQSEGQFGRQLKARADALAARGVTIRRTAVKGTDFVELCLISDEQPERPTGASAVPPVGVSRRFVQNRTLRGEVREDGRCVDPWGRRSAKAPSLTSTPGRPVRS
jgi:hypothetical protein